MIYESVRLALALFISKKYLFFLIRKIFSKEGLNQRMMILKESLI